MQPLPTELAYIAGLVDGEGCIRHTGKTEHVSITSCYPHHLLWIKKLSECGNVREMKDHRPGHRSAYRFEAFGTDAISFLNEIRPFLKEKAYQADILLSIRGLPAKSAARKMAITELSKAKRIDYGSD